jgi:hypothetical protein
MAGTEMNMNCTLNRVQVIELARQYVEQEPFEQNMGRENKALLAGQKIREGNYALENLMPIVEWKSQRPKGLISRNKPLDVADALATLAHCKRDRTKVSSLIGLRGVQVPMASAILTVFDPERYTIIDVRALQTLGIRQPYLSVDHYLEYLAFCRAGASEVTLRDFDRALSQMSKNGGEPIGD